MDTLELFIRLPLFDASNRLQASVSSPLDVTRMHSIMELLGTAWRHRAELFAAGTVLLTGVYAILTYFILRANRRIVAAMQTQSEQARQFHMRQHFLAGIAAIA